MTRLMVSSRALRGFIRRRLDPNAYLGLYATIGVALLWLTVWAFSKLLDAVLDKEPVVHIDETAAQWMHEHTTSVGLRVFAVITELGVSVAWLVFGVVIALLLYHRRTTLLITWLVAYLGGKVLVEILKSSVHRTRPIYGIGVHESYSFPSAHTMNATICYTMLAFIVVHVYELTGVRRTLVYGAAMCIVGAVGFSRVYLGVHYPSDVLGGFMAGAACVTAGLTAYSIVRRRSKTANSQV